MPRPVPDLTADTPWAGLRHPWWMRVGSLVFLAVTLLLAMVTVTALLAGDVPAALGMAAGAVLFGHLAGLTAYAWWRPGRRRAAPHLGDGGLVFPFSRWTYYWTTSTVLLFTVPILIGGVWAAATGSGGAVVLAAVGAALTVFALLVTRRLLPGAPGSLTLSPEGLHHQGAGFTHFAPWDTVLAVRAAELQHAPLLVIYVRPSDDVVVERRPLRSLGTWDERMLPLMTVQGTWLAADPDLVYRTVRHYHSHPYDRAELSSAHAVERVAQGRLMPR